MNRWKCVRNRSLNGMLSKEQVHQVRLAPPHAAPHIEAGHRLALRPPQAHGEALHHTALVCGKEFVVDALQLVHRTLLGRIVHESWSLQFGMITIDRAHIPPLRRDHRPRGGAQFIGALT
jgi:hypothetical protein